MHNVRLSSMSDCVVFFDFDNTITLFDVLDDIIKHFSVNKNWQSYEKLWKEGKIGSQKCLEEQLKSVKVSKKDLLHYLSWVRIDPNFHKLYSLMHKSGLIPVILSDNFTLVIRAILENNGIKGAKIYANSLRFNVDTLMPSFPYANRLCTSCAHCKKKNLLRKGLRDKIIIYIGDGLSDVCPAECSDMVFAKAGGKLHKYFRKTKRLCLGFNNLDDIYNYFRGLAR